MWEQEKTVIITNNPAVAEKYRDKMEVILEKDYESVLIETRDRVYTGYTLLTHPQASSLKPNQTPYRSVMIYPKKDRAQDNTNDILLIEKCIEVYRQWQAIAPTPKSYEEKVDRDFRTIDLSVIDNIIPRLM